MEDVEVENDPAQNEVDSAKDRQTGRQTKCKIQSHTDRLRRIRD